MPSSVLDDSKVAELIGETRAQVLAEMDRQPELFDLNDVERVRTDDWQVERFLLRKNYSVPDSVKMMVATMKWRQQLRIPSLVDRDFPRELFQIGATFSCGHDRQGNGLVYMRIKYHRRIKEIDWYHKQFIMYTLDKVDVATQGRGMAAVFDCTGAGLANVDMDTAWFLVCALIRYCPHGLNYVLVLDLPWVLTSAWSVIKSWLPTDLRQLIKFVTRPQLSEYIDQENLPHYLGGQCKLNSHAVPAECRSLVEMTDQYDITTEEARRIVEAFKPYLNEAEHEVKILNRFIDNENPVIGDSNQACTAPAM